jgi:protein involved in polysaccharide export with SLBB domain
VFGDVNAPGYYAVAPDALVGDVLMRAGGLARTADPDRMTVRRGPTTLVVADALRRAVVAGQTLDELGLRAGDEIVVPARRDWADYARTGALVASALVGVVLIRHR